MKFTSIILWCQMNYADTARIKAVLQNCWRDYVDSIKEADIVIFDTCSVRQKSEDKVSGKMMEIPSDKKIWITWCMIQHTLRNTVVKKKTTGKGIKWLMGMGNFVGTVQTIDPDIIGLSNIEIEEFRPLPWLEENIVYINHAFNPMFHRFQKSYKNLELFFRIDDTGFLPLILKRLWYEITYDIEITNEYSSIIPFHNTTTQNTLQSKSAFVPISTGCNQFCSFCIVPYARGMEKHFPKEQIIEEVQHHINNGVEEITLLWQIVNKHPQFVDILKSILSLSGNLKWLRYTSPYPTYYSKELLELHESEVRLCPHIHIPLQSWSTPILKKMFRGYNREQFIEFIDKIKKSQRSISITTDIIVGFCDETEEDFNETLSLIEYTKPDMIYIGIYSNRPGTYADRKYQDNISKKIKRERRNKLNELLRAISLSNNQKEVGTTKTMIITSKKKSTTCWYEYHWYTDNMKQTLCLTEDETKHYQIWQFVTIKVVDWRAFQLIWKIIS